jgi:excinuclease UvrABC helicase subunit UvrB
MSDFDNLYNEFLDNSDDDKNDDLVNEEAKKILDMISNFKQPVNEMDADKLDKELEANLGDPDVIEYYKEEDFYVERRIWYKNSGMIIKTLMNDVPFENANYFKEPIDLEKELDEALKLENYELAVTLRDQIKKLKAKQKRLEKKNLKK